MSVRAARMNPEARDHFIKDEQPIEPDRDVAQSLEEIAANRNRAKMAAGRLQNDTTNLRIIHQCSLDSFRIVRRNDDRVGRRLSGYAWNRLVAASFQLADVGQVGNLPPPDRQIRARDQIIMPAVKMAG